MGNQIPLSKKKQYQREINNMMIIFEESYKNNNEHFIPCNSFKFFKWVPEIQNNSFVLNKESFDFAVLIYSTKDDIIDINISNNHIARQQLKANTYSILKTNPIPVSSIYYSWANIKIITENPGDIHLIYGNCSVNMCEFLKKNIISTMVFDGKEENEIIYSRGKVFVDKQEIKDFINKWDAFNTIIKIPNLYIKSEEYRKYLANKVSKMIYFELLEITLNPDRIRSHMSIDDLRRYGIK